MFYRDMDQLEQADALAESGVLEVHEWSGPDHFNQDDRDETLLVKGTEETVDRLGKLLAVCDHDYRQVTPEHFLLATYHS